MVSDQCTKYQNRSRSRAAGSIARYRPPPLPRLDGTSQRSANGVFILPGTIGTHAVAVRCAVNGVRGPG